MSAPPIDEFDEPTRPDSPGPMRRRSQPGIPARDERTPVPPYTGDEREWFAQLVHDVEKRLGRRLADVLRELREEHASLAKRVSELERFGGESLHQAFVDLAEKVAESTTATREAMRMLHDARERVSCLEGQAKGEERAERRLAPWVKPAAVGTSWAAGAAGVIVLVLRMLGWAAPVEPVVPPPAASQGMSRDGGRPEGPG